MYKWKYFIENVEINNTNDDFYEEEINFTKNGIEITGYPHLSKSASFPDIIS